MNRRKIRKIEPIAATAPVRQVEVGCTNSIFSDPDGRWIAKRQQAIDEAFEKRLYSQLKGRREVVEAPLDQPTTVKNPTIPVSRLSGESERIGTGEWDETIPFGEHVGFL